MSCEMSTSVTTDEYLANMLCQACKFLTVEQMQSIKGLDIYIGLHDWYVQHLLKNFNKNYDNEIIRDICLIEANRLGYSIVKTYTGARIDCL